MTATIDETDTGLDMTVLDELDFEPALVCEWGKDGGRHCSNEAEWVLRYKCCDDTLLICTVHKYTVEKLAAKVLGHTEHAKCKKLVEIKSIDRI